MTTEQQQFAVLMLESMCHTEALMDPASTYLTVREDELLGLIVFYVENSKTVAEHLQANL